MREHIFRGKTNSGKWKEGSLVYSANIQTAIFFEVGEGLVKSFDWVCADPETVGEWTGLTDVNGIKVFEGDIIKFRMSFHKTFARSGQVIWDTEQLSYVCDDQQIGLCAEILVIGNIHDELLQ